MGSQSEQIGFHPTEAVRSSGVVQNTQNSALPSREGELLAGRYRLARRLGVGGVGEVYRAVNERIGREVAIKVLRPEMLQYPNVIERFLREARAANVVKHPHVVDVVDIDQDDRGAPFIVQELLHGCTLFRYMQEAGGALTLDQILGIMVPVVSAVAEAHARGLVHRDLKPENVFLTEVSGAVFPKVLDFGLSKIEEDNPQRLTSSGTTVGTPLYMSPEQIQETRNVDTRTDVWALGVMLYEMASGQLPFRADSAGALFVMICTKDPIPLHLVAPKVSPAYAKIVERCMRRERTQRYPTASEVLRDLLHLRAGEDLEATGQVTTVDPHRAQGPLLRVSAQEATRGLFVRPVEPVSSNPAAVPRAVLQTSPRPKSPMRLVIPGVVALLTLTGVLGVWYFTREPAPTPATTATVASPRPRRPAAPTAAPTPPAAPPSAPPVAPAPQQTPTVAQTAQAQPEAQPEAQTDGRHGSRRGHDRHSRRNPAATEATTPPATSTTTTTAAPPATAPTQGTAVANTPPTQSGSTTLHGGTQTY